MLIRSQFEPGQNDDFAFLLTCSILFSLPLRFSSSSDRNASFKRIDTRVDRTVLNMIGNKCTQMKGSWGAQQDR